MAKYGELYAVCLWLVDAKRKSQRSFSFDILQRSTPPSYDSHILFSPTDIFLCQYEFKGTPAAGALQVRTHNLLSIGCNDNKGLKAVYVHVVVFDASQLSCNQRACGSQVR